MQDAETEQSVTLLYPSHIIYRKAPGPWQTRNELALFHDEQKKFIRAQTDERPQA